MLRTCIKRLLIFSLRKTRWEENRTHSVQCILSINEHMADTCSAPFLCLLRAHSKNNKKPAPAAASQRQQFVRRDVNYAARKFNAKHLLSSLFAITGVPGVVSAFLPCTLLSFSLYLSISLFISVCCVCDAGMVP